MAKTTKEGAKQIDRWATLNSFVGERMAKENESTGSPSAAVVWLTLFTLADGKTGRVRGASISRLSRLTAFDRKTTAKAVQHLLKVKLLTIVEKGEVPVYEVFHVPKDDE